MSMDEYLKLWTSLLLDWRVLFSVAALFILGALLRFVAVGRRNPGALKRPILKILQRMTAQDKIGPASTAVPQAKAGEDEESEDIGLEEEAYPADEPLDNKRKRGTRR